MREEGLLMAFQQHLTLIGFGEAGQAFVRGWTDSSVLTGNMRAYDIKTTGTPDQRAWKWADYASFNISGFDSLEEALKNVSVVFSLVTADKAYRAAEQVARYLSEGSFFFDCNSCAPDTKKKSAEVIESHGGRYIDVAIMAPVHPLLNRTPLLISGKDVDSAAKILTDLNMRPKTKGKRVGTASAIKLSRSILVKGMEALMAECLLTAHIFDVQDEVLSSMEDSHPGFSWQTHAGHAIERMVVHGLRREAEMNEAANMVEASGLPAHLSRGTALWQRQVAEFGRSCRGTSLDKSVKAVLQGFDVKPQHRV